MIYLVDGSNVLGRAGADRESVDDKRVLLRAAAAFARRVGPKLVLFFDGPPPPGFASSLGAVRATFSGSVPADNLIVEAAHQATEPVVVVTADVALSDRVIRRGVTTLAPGAFLSQLDAPPEDGLPQEDWERYFSDPKNRETF